MRKKMRKPMTAHAIDLAISKLQKLSAGDKDIAVDIVNQSIERGWTAFYPLPEKKTTAAAELDDFYSMAKKWAERGGENDNT